MKLKKKGFTIVELVIVIAVIAILAAVLIPTFANLINRANRSADEQAVRQMNTALMVEDFSELLPETIDDALVILQGAGFQAKNYKPLTDSTSFYWNKTENRVMIISSGKVIYPESYVSAFEEIEASEGSDGVWFNLVRGELTVNKDVQTLDRLNAALSAANSRPTSAMKAVELTGASVEDLIPEDSATLFAYDRSAGQFYSVKADSLTEIVYPSGKSAKADDLIFIVNEGTPVTTDMTAIYFNDFETIERSDVEAVKNTLVSVEFGAGVTRIANPMMMDEDGYYVDSNREKVKVNFKYNGSWTDFYFKNIDGEIKYVNSDGEVVAIEGRDILDDLGTKAYDPNNGAFFDFQKIESVYIGVSVQEIGYASFASSGSNGGCKSLKYVYYNANAEIVKNINNYYPFKNVGNSTGVELEIGNNVTSVPNLFGTDSSCNVNKVTFEENTQCKIIDVQAFYGFRITEITLPKSLTNINGSSTSVAFYGCSSLTTIYWFGNAITCGNGTTYSKEHQDSSGTGLSGFQEYMRGAGSHTAATSVVITLLGE